MNLDNNEVEGGHCLICRLPAKFGNGQWSCSNHPDSYCEICDETTHDTAECNGEVEVYDPDDFGTGGYVGIYQK